MTAAPAPAGSRGLLYATVTMAGMVTLAAEFTASRLIQAVFGASNLVWANVIGLVLLALTCGYFAGGRLADRWPHPRIFYILALVSGVLTGGCLLITSVVLQRQAGVLATLRLGNLLGSLLVVVVALALPVFLLGCLSPFAVRLAVDDVGQAGRVSGQVYALSTIGSLLGTYLPVLVTIPLIGVRRTAFLFGAVLALVAAVGLWRSGGRQGAGVGVMLLLIMAGWVGYNRVGPRPGELFAAESAYNTIRVVEEESGCRYLLLNEGLGFHSVYCPHLDTMPHALWPLLAAVPLLRQMEVQQVPQHVAVVGLAGGTAARLMAQAYPDVVIDGIEIDPAVIEVAARYFGPPLPNLSVHQGDGRAVLRTLPGPYDVVIVDAYRVPYIPWHMTTREFFAEVASRLAQDGIVVINAGRVPGDRTLIDALVTTLGDVFLDVWAVDVPDALNTLIVAGAPFSDEPSVPPHAPGWLPEAVETAVAQRAPLGPATQVLTDDRAPVEALVDTLVLRYLVRAANPAE